MILQALTEYYQSLVQAEKIAAPGWKSSDISFVLCISDEGELEQVISIKNQVSQGKKTVLRPQSMILPVPADGRTSTAVRPNFLWDKSDYLLGISKGGTQRGIKYFNGAKEYHEAILSGVVSPAATALLAFFQQWDPEKAPEHPALQDAMEDILKGANMVFRYSGGYIHEDPEIRDAWQRHYADQSTGIEMTCLVTGKQAAVARIHPKIKGIINGEAMGNTLVGFNSPSVCSYGKEQSYNAPVSQQAAFAYTAALNYLLADREHVYRLGDATVVCWARGGGDAYQAFFGGALLGAPTPYSAADLRGMTAQLCQGIPVDFQEDKLDPNMDFYILGLSPNAARLSVRFFLHNTFQGFLDHIQAHYDRLEIAQSNDNKFDNIPLWRLLYATVRSQTKYEPSSYKEAKQNLEKYLPPELSGEILRSILMNTRYPATLLNGITLRIRAEHEITRSRAAAIKACLLQNYRCLPIYSTLREVLTVELNDSCNYQPYVLGRLFAVMEQIQLASADWKLNRTIKDSYFTSAATTPKNIYAKLFPLSEYHMKKLLRDKPGLANILGKEKGSLIGKLTAPIPPRFMPEETDCFYIGYYHQSNQKKEEKEHV
ncbi:type I-C CRISPR-associated protein Cas8c/Csd1 [Flavonifractor plautii]|uniref:type I-C CRISPR-associated protein Cas8c/Csd1 n=1 Tax=Flavonifractor plautii TaxID=292800 RepID=UPI003DA65005